MDHNKQQRDQYGQQSNWGQQGRQQDQWREGSDMDTNYNMQQSTGQQPGYGDVYHGNLRQREEETNRARGRNYGQQGGQYQGGMFQGRQHQDYNPGGYGQVGNTGGGYGGWDSHGSSGQDMGGSYGNRSHMDYGQQRGFGNTSGGMNRQGSYGQDEYRGASQYRGDSDQYGYNRRHDDSNDNSWWDRAKNEVKGWFSDDDDRGRNRNYNMHEGAMAGNRRMVGGDHDSDHRSRGEHFGKGPRGYKRSEDRIREDVCERLAYDGSVDASDIEVKVEGHEVVLTGTVRSRAEKRRAEDLVESIMGVQNVENRIRVHDQNSGSWMQASNRGNDDSRSYGSTTGDSSRSAFSDSSRSGLDDSSRNTSSDRYSSTSGTTGSSSIENRSYTGNSGDQSGIGNESGTTNEIIRNSGAADTNL